MTHATTEQLRVTPLGEHIGAQIDGIDLAQPLDARTVAFIKDAWERHLVLRFRGQTQLSLQGQIAFSRHFGELDKRPIAAKAMHASVQELPDEIAIISNVKIDAQPIGGLGDGESVWHADMTYNPTPPRAALLHAHEVPASGGDTQFLNLYAAYEGLPQDLKQTIAGLDCIHDASINSAGELRLGFERVTDPRNTVGARHPLVRIHPVTGRKSLYLGRRRNAYVPGLSLADSEELLDTLWAHAVQDAFTWRQQWQPGDLVGWDNRVTLHRRDAFDPLARRLMYRTQVSDRVQ
ncbi:TauD/TfdA dioxygenase family protein [Comamonas endophytica]|uniref:TauD/TfdA family dioxygenase n=1 Tax=Comamonas endophytica TaxID=2949090 RepID=A0ABY6GAN8_9BURK|nr:MULTISPECIES: TauD/TfdA family dioxygenase [unclassified Acidovorax]MCD2513885.1 TauD/TfdA family dioxygenase [Acidovorax sp. D4N7]UYG52119.1 TauD/TfdA family dioxygenase [Acidovorax sp. 5MLIR]